MRKRLDFDRPVGRTVIEECLRVALQAPTGGNRQRWHWVVVADAARRRALAEQGLSEIGAEKYPASGEVRTVMLWVGSANDCR